MIEDWEFLFDLCGYLHVPGVLDAAEVAAANAAVDNHQFELPDRKRTPFSKLPAMRGLRGGSLMDCWCFQTESDADAPQRQDLRHMLGWDGDDRVPFTNMLAHPALTPYLNVICGKGFRMVRFHAFSFTREFAVKLAILIGPRADADHPREGLACGSVPALTRQQSAPQLDIISRDISERLLVAAGGLHGASGPGFDPNQYYVWKGGQMHNGLVVVAFQLVDTPSGAGGLAVVPGSHKGNISAPQSMRQHKTLTEFVKQPVTKAGDVVIFTEATTHGTLPWTAEYQRRSILFRYSPANLAFGGGRHAFDRDVRSGHAWPESWYEGLSDEQIAVLEPYARKRLRPRQNAISRGGSARRISSLKIAFVFPGLTTGSLTGRSSGTTACLTKKATRCWTRGALTESGATRRRVTLRTRPAQQGWRGSLRLSCKCGRGGHDMNPSLAPLACRQPCLREHLGSRAGSPEC